MLEYYSLSSLSIVLLAVRVYYAQFAEFKQLNILNNYTTQACSNCGALNKPNDRSYVCSKCDMEIHRDANGALNIGLKHVH